MKIINGISTLVVFMVLLQGCMPDNLTKFKEDPVKKQPVVEVPTTPSDFYTTFGSTSATRRMSIELEDNTVFKSTLVTQVISGTGSLGTINFTDDKDNVYLDVPLASKFVIGDSVDDGSTFIKKESTVTGVNFVFPPNTVIDVIPGASNPSSLTSGVTFSITPNLPTGLSLNTTTGQISGSVSVIQDIEKYTLSVVGSGFSLSYNFGIGIIEAPEVLSFSNLQILKVSNPAKFNVGSNITSSPITPSTDIGRGIVKYKSTNYLVVEILDKHLFLKNQLIDNEDEFIASEGNITEDPETITSFLTVASTVGFTSYKTPTVAGFIICQPSNAKAVIKKIDGTTIFISQTRTSASTYDGDFENDGVQLIYSDENCDANNPVGLGRSQAGGEIVLSTWSPNSKVTITDATGFKKGFDVISDVSASGYISSMSGLNLEISGNTQAYFDVGDTLDPVKPYNAGTLITKTATNMKLSLDVGTESIILASLYKGADLYYTVSPALPDGLELASDTGIISGVPTKSQVKTTYTVVAKNVVGNQSVIFDLEVNDYFSIVDETSGAPSYILHKNGQANKNTKCRINKDDIENFASSTGDKSIVDIDCMLEAGESDLFNLGLKLKSYSGKSVCEFVRYRPFSYYQFKPVQSSVSQYAKIVSNTCPGTTGAVPTDSVLLNGGLNYGDMAPGASDVNFTGGNSVLGVDVDQLCAYSNNAQNCDTGTVTYVKVDISESEANPLNCVYKNSGVEVVSCGGNIKACLQGPIREVLSPEEIQDNNKTSIITAADSGIDKEHTISAPNTKGYSTNRYIANSVKNNSCNTISDETVTKSNGWDLYSKLPVISSISDYTNPFAGANPFYTFTCLDSAYDIKARIRLTVREWDRNFTATDNIDSIYATLMDDSTLDFSNDSYNQVADWDDSQLTGLTGCTDTTAPSSATVVPYGYYQLPGYVTTDGTNTMIGIGTNFSNYTYPKTIIIDPFATQGAALTDTGVGSQVANSNTSFTLEAAQAAKTNVPIAFDLGGTITGNENEYNISGSNFNLVLKQGMKLVLDPGNANEETVYIRSVNSNNSATLMAPLTNTHAAVAAEKEATYVFPGNDI